MPEIRKLDVSELPKLAALYKNAYRVDSATVQEWIDQVNLEHTRAITDAERVLSVIQILPYGVQIGGRPLPMAGIGGVATWADQQGNGHAGLLMRASVREMYERGFPISILYPFSYRYYGKFGWAMAARRVVYTNFWQNDVVRDRNALPVRAVVTEQDFECLKQVYAKFLDAYNCLMVRGEREWGMRHRQWGKDRFHYYLVLDEDGKAPRGYFTCEDKPLESLLYETIVRELVCLDGKAYAAVFNFLATLPTNVRKITVGHAERPWLWQYFHEPFIETRVDPYFQARVVDITKACEARGYHPDVAATVTFALHDEIGSWNEGCWRLEVAQGQGMITRTQATPEIELTIQQFSAVFVGFQDPTEWVETGILPCAAFNAAAKLRTIFCDKPTSLLDFF